MPAQRESMSSVDGLQPRVCSYFPKSWERALEQTLSRSIPRYSRETTTKYLKEPLARIQVMQRSGFCTIDLDQPCEVKCEYPRCGKRIKLEKRPKAMNSSTGGFYPSNFLKHIRLNHPREYDELHAQYPEHYGPRVKGLVLDSSRIAGPSRYESSNTPTPEPVHPTLLTICLPAKNVVQQKRARYTPYGRLKMSPELPNVGYASTNTQAHNTSTSFHSAPVGDARIPTCGSDLSQRTRTIASTSRSHVYLERTPQEEKLIDEAHLLLQFHREPRCFAALCTHIPTALATLLTLPVQEHHSSVYHAIHILELIVSIGSSPAFGGSFARPVLDAPIPSPDIDSTVRHIPPAWRRAIVSPHSLPPRHDPLA
ncbi:hypothetical protein NMY22_g3645 [Coprinellus aureogranulatus]|nr:hypothetical protein NMY22_g3645 [Coprinellus aureogranulatus]